MRCFIFCLLFIPGLSLQAAEAMRDTLSRPAEQLAPEATESADSGSVARPAVPFESDTALVAPAVDTSDAATPSASLRAPYLTKLELGGTVQLKGFYHNMSDDEDAEKRMSLTLRRMRLDVIGELGDRFGFEGQFRLESNGQNLGIEAGYLHYDYNEWFGLKGGKIKRPFSQEALQSSKALYTVERGELYQTFLAEVTGYSSYDVGLAFYGGYEDEEVPVTYEAGVFNGKQNHDPDGNYRDQHYVGIDEGFQAKDVALRLTVSPFKLLKVEAAVSTKAAEDTSDRANFKLAVNTAYELGLDFSYRQLRIMGEAAWGDNHQGQDSGIISGTTLFFAFYAMGVWHEDYRGGRASELVLKLEGLDPDFEPGSEEGTPNDGKLQYTLGCNYFFTPRVSLLADYSILQPITKVSGQKALTHNLDVMWRMSF